MAATLTVNITQNSQSIANNTSNVTVNAVISWTNGSWNALGQCSGSITIDGTKYSFSGMSFNTGHTTSGKQTVMTKTVNVTHNSDGTKNLSFSASFNTEISVGTIGASATKTLTTIPRKSTLSVANGTLGTAQTLTVTRKSTSFTHTITATCSGSTSTVCTKSSGTSISFTPPISWSSKNTTGTSVSVKYTITTYSGSTNVGSNSYTKTCSIPASVKPSCTVAISDSMGYETTYGNPIKGLSKFKVTVTPTTSYGSPIDSYKTTANGATYTTASFTTDVLKSYGTVSVTATVKDKRGRTSSTASASKTVLDYSVPKITTLTVRRCDKDGTPNDQGDAVQVTFAYSVTSLNGKNTSSCVLKYKKSSESDYTTPSDFDSAAGLYIIENADTGSSYDVSLSVTDNFNTTTKNVSASTAFTIMHWKADGTAMAIGKVSEESHTFDVGLDTRFRREAKSDHNDTAFNHTHPDTGVRVGFGVGKGAYNHGVYSSDMGRWLIYNDGKTNPDVAKPGTTYIGTEKGYIKPYYAAGDIINAHVRTAGYITDGSKDLAFTIPLYVPIVGSPKITVDVTSGFVLRCNGKYTHGSSSNADGSVLPTSIWGANTGSGGIYVGATFSDVTDATNNDAYGIIVTLKITLS